jgi:hypothetical protein
MGTRVVAAVVDAKPRVVVVVVHGFFVIVVAVVVNCPRPS